MRKSLSLLACALLVTVGCTAKVEQSAAKTINTHCPIMGEEVTEDGGTTDYEGQTVGFCCEKCVDKFNAKTDAEKQEALATKGQVGAAH